MSLVVLSSYSMEKYGQEVHRRRERAGHDSRLSSEKFSHHHFAVFFVTFASFAFVHATRKTFSNVKHLLINEWTQTNTSDRYLLDYELWNSRTVFSDTASAELFLGTLDTIFMAAYAVGLFVSGPLGDRVDLRKLLSTGMFLTSISVVLFGVMTEWIGFYSPAFYVVLWIINGLLQSTSWPSVVAIMGNWFSKNKRGLVLGAWSSCSALGNIFGSYIAAAVLEYGYEWAILVTAAVLLCSSFVAFCGTVPKPSDLGMLQPDEGGCYISTSDLNYDENWSASEGEGENENLVQSDNHSIQSPPPQTVGFLQAFLLPGVLAYSLCFACLKFVNYAFFFWLPYYLSNNFHWNDQTSARVSVWNDVGAIFGPLIGGIISDRLRVRAPVLVVMMLAAVPALYLFGVAPNDITTNAFFMTLVGVFIGGASGLISTTVSADLGRQEELKQNSAALATVIGIVDGIGSLGAALGLLMVPLAEQWFGWHSVFHVFVAVTFLACILIGPVCYRECKGFCTQWRMRRQYEPIVGEDNITPIRQVHSCPAL